MNLQLSDTRARQRGRFLSRGGSLALARMPEPFLPLLPTVTNGTSRTNHQIGILWRNRKYCDRYRITGNHRGAPIRDALMTAALDVFKSVAEGFQIFGEHRGAVLP